MIEPNDYLWFLPDRLGRWFWAPLPFYGALGMYFLYKLAAPITKLGRVIRVMLGVAFISLIFSPAINGLGPWAIHFLGLGSALVVMQVYLQCLADGKIIKSTAPTWIERMAERVRQPHKSVM